MMRTFKYENHEGEAKQRKRLDIRNGVYAYELWPHQKEMIESLPPPGKSYLFEFPVGSGKTRMLANIVKNNFLANEEHTACIVVAANAGQAQSQMLEFGVLGDQFGEYAKDYGTDIKPYTQSIDSFSKKNIMAWRLKNTVHPTVTMSPHMFARIMNVDPKKGRRARASADTESETDTTFPNQLRLITELGPDTKHIVIVIDEVHDMYGPKQGKNKNQVKYASQWHNVFKMHGISVTMIGASATLALDSEHAQENAARLLNVDVDDLPSITHTASRQCTAAHETKKKECGTVKTKSPIARPFNTTPAECTRNISKSVDELAHIIVGSEVMRHSDEFYSNMEVCALQRDLAFKNCITHVSMEMMLSEDFISKVVGSSLVKGQQMNADGEWEEVTMNPNAVVFFQTDRMKQTYLSESEKSDQVIAIDLPTNSEKVDEALSQFSDARIMEKESDEETESEKIVILCPSRIYRKGSNVFNRFPPSVLICVGNYSKYELKQMYGRVGRFCDNWKVGDCKPEDPIKIVNINLRWASAVQAKVLLLKNTSSRKTTRTSRCDEEFDSLFSSLTDVVEREDEIDLKQAKVSATILQTISLLDTPSTKHYLGNLFLRMLAGVTSHDANEANRDKYWYSIRTHTQNIDAVEFDEEDATFEQGMEEFVEEEAVDAQEGSSSSDPLPLPPGM